jgi:hypothetical protein
MSSRPMLHSAPFVAFATTLLVFATIGGCPTPQQPVVPTVDEPNSNRPSTGQSDTGIDRPIPPPPLDALTTIGSPDGSAGGSSGGTSGSGSAGGAGAFFLTIQEPAGSVRVRPGTPVNLVFQFADPQSAVQSIELLVARDSDGDGAADGAPIMSQGVTFVTGGNTVTFNTNGVVPFLTNGFGKFKLGARTRTVAGVVKDHYASGTLTVDAQAPTGAWLAPMTNLLTNRTSVNISVHTDDNSPVTISIALDEDLNPTNGVLQTLLPPTTVAAGTITTNLTPSLLSIAPGRVYHYYVTVSDGIDPPLTFYAERSPGDPVKIRVTDRLVGDFSLDSLTSKSQNRGAILQGFNFNDLAGSSISGVPDLNGDGNDELIIASRFGKAHLIENNGVGFGEAYMIYGSAAGLSGTTALNSVGVGVPGLIFPGIRTPRNASIAPQNQSTRWTAGLSDVTVIPDMDGDNLPELVFSFPRVESINLGETNPTIQHPELAPDLPAMGNLEYTAFYGLPPTWHPNEAQFTRGGIVIVSSHDEMLRFPTLKNRKSDRVLDLHEVGQLFSNMGRPGLIPYIRQVVPRSPAVCADCDGVPGDFDPGDPESGQPGTCLDDGCYGQLPVPVGKVDGRETLIARWIVNWDTVLSNQGPGGFANQFTIPSANPPLANMVAFPFNPLYPFPFVQYPNYWIRDDGGSLGSPANQDACDLLCEVTNQWFSWAPTLPCTTLAGTPAWATGGAFAQNPLPNCYPDNPAKYLVPPGGDCPAYTDAPACTNPPVTPNAGGGVVWTGFYPPGVTAFVGTATGQVFPTPMGARILGQAVEDRFGTALSSDGTWLYMSAPERTANAAPYGSDVPALAGTRSKSGIVYQLRTNAPGPSGVTRTQLWLERGTFQVQDPNASDPNDPNSFITVFNSWPKVDAEEPARNDYTMPVPHQYIIEAIGSLRGNPEIGKADRAFGDESQTCPPPYNPNTDSPVASACASYTPYPVGTSGFYVDRTPQVVGPHVNAKIEFVRALGDVNGDGIRDFAVGSAGIKSKIINPAPGDPNVGAIFIVYGRPTGVEGDYLLEQLSHNISDANRLAGVLIKGANPNETLARVFSDAGYFKKNPGVTTTTYIDFNGDAFADVIIGNEGAEDSSGEALIILGSDTLSSPGPDDAGGVPGGGWTPDTIDPTRVIRILGSNPGDRVGANVASAGDVDGDGFADVLVAAPGADGGRGAVFLIYGGKNVPGVISVASLTPENIDVPFARFAGRKVNDFLGGGSKLVSGTSPAGGTTLVTSQGVAPLGDVNQDGLADFGISAMLADPGGKADAGEVYILHGKAGP